MIKTICVFCGSSTGDDPVYAERAERLARFFLVNNIHLVYGGANVGLMRVMADTILKGNGKVIGVMPKNLVHREVAHLDLTVMHVVDDMQQRKVMMAELSDGFMTLPGAYGTFDELFEMLTWNQLHILEKPIGLLNIKGFFNPLLKMLDKAVKEKFLRPEHRGILLVEKDESILLKRMNEYKPVQAEKWIERLKEGKI
ncbi:MAG: TIGR00730 family Rossman fold protein [Bacteroidales bacterium]|jgi:uncharacterized protein (TIGR00730 family)